MNNSKPFIATKKPFKHTVLGKILIGATDAFTGGTVSNIVYADETTASGQIDWKKAGASLSTLILITSFVLGKIKLDDLLQLINMLK
jgi:hypothetical protein